MKKLAYLLLLVFLLVILWPLTGSATPVTLEVLSVTPGTPVTGTFPGFGTITAKSGEYVLSTNGDVFNSYCVEMRLAPNVPSDYSLVPVPSGTPFHEAAWIMENYAPVVTGSDNPTLRVDTALAIWEVISDTGYNLNTGAFNITSGWDTTNAQNILAALQSADITTVNLDAFRIATDDDGLSVVGNQDYLIHQPVPEPNSILLLGSGLIGFAGLWRKVRKT